MAGSQLAREATARRHSERARRSESLGELDDPYNTHFDLAAQRELGRRSAETMLSILEAP